MTRRDHHTAGGRSALERLAGELAARDAERETRERLRQARVEARRDRSEAAVTELRTLMAELWERILEVAPMAMAYSANALELEQGRVEWDIEHGFVAEEAFERSEWDVYAGAWIRVQQRGSVFEYPGCSSSLWFARLPGQPDAAWHEVAYNAEEGNGPAEEPFALKDLIKADLVASSEPSNLFHAFEPDRIDGSGREAFFDRWMGLLAGAAAGDLERPALHAEAPADVELDAGAPTPADDAQRPADNSLFGRLRGLGG